MFDKEVNYLERRIFARLLIIISRKALTLVSSTLLSGSK